MIMTKCIQHHLKKITELVHLVLSVMCLILKVIGVQSLVTASLRRSQMDIITEFPKGTTPTLLVSVVSG